MTTSTSRTRAVTTAVRGAGASATRAVAASASRLVEACAMRALWLFLCLASATLLMNSASAAPTPILIGYLSWDVTEPGRSGRFDIVNLSGANSSGDASWPVLTAVSLADLTLVVQFDDGSASTFDSSYFALSADGYSFDGSALAIDASRPMPADALLTGLLGPSQVELFDGQSLSLANGFSATIVRRNAGLLDGDFGVIDATPIVVAAVPEPGATALLTAGLSLLVAMRRRRRCRNASAAAAAAICVIGAALALPASAGVKLNTWTAPSGGTAGSDYVNVTATGVTLAPGVTLQAATLELATACGGVPVATLQAASVKPLVANAWRIQFLLPVSLGSGTYSISMVGIASDSSAVHAATCSQVDVLAVRGASWTTLISREWSVGGGAEGYKCVAYRVPEDTFISAFHAMSPPGSFRLLLTVSDTPTTVGLFDCNADAVGPHGVFMSGPGGNDLELPAGAAVRLRAGQYLLLNLHLLNQSAQAATGLTGVQIRTVTAATVTSPTELQRIGTTNLNIPPDSIEHAFAGHCAATRSLDILAFAPQANFLADHIQVTRTVASAGSTSSLLLDTAYAASLQQTYPTVPPIHIEAGDILTATCRFRNTTGQAVTFGPSVVAEQCYVGVYATPPNTMSTSSASPPLQPIDSCIAAGSL